MPWAWISYKPESARRNFGELREKTLGGDLAYALKFGAPERGVTLKIGGAHRTTERDADSRFYNILGSSLSRSQREGSPEEIFDGRYAQGGDESLLLTLSTAGGAYRADEDVTATFAMGDVPLGSRLRLIGGARMERWTLGLNARPVLGEPFTSQFHNTDLLPLLTLNLTVSGSQNIRLSVSRTLSRPEYRELAPISYREALGDQVAGQHELHPTAESEAEHRGDRRLGEGAQRAEHALDLTPVALPLGRPERAALLQVGAHAEGALARRAEHDDPHLRVASELLEPRPQLARRARPRAR